MKLIPRVTPVTLEKKAEIERALLAEEQKLLDASLGAARALGKTLSPRNVFTKHPLEAALLAMAAGIYIGRVMRPDQSKTEETSLQDVPFKARDAI